MTSKSSGRTFRISVAWPLHAKKPPDDGYPVVYVLDGNAMFATVVEQTRREAQVGELKPAIVVGIGYPTDNPAQINVKRIFDLSPPVDDATLPPMLKGAKTGGAAELEKFLLNTLQPKIEALFHTNREDRVLIGHSLGGLFVLRTLFDRPQAFHSYIAISPSIWWNNRALLNDEPAFAKAVNAGKITPRILILVGGLEQTASAGPRPPGMSVKAYAKVQAMAKMIDNARSLGKKLAALHGKSGYETRMQVLRDATHNSEVPAALARGLTFALQP